MKTTLRIFLFLFGAIVYAQTPATLPAYEPFDYTEGTQLIDDDETTGAPHWLQRSSRNPNDTEIIASPSWSDLTDIATPEGGAITLFNFGADIEYVFNERNANNERFAAIYASFIITVRDLARMDTNRGQVISFGYQSNSSGNLVRNASVQLRLVEDGSSNPIGYNIGVNNGQSSSAIDWDATVFEVNDEVLLVLKKAGTEEVSLFVNPPVTENEPTTFLDGGTRTVLPTRVVLDQVNHEATPRLIFDELRVAATWRDAIGGDAALSTSRFEMVENSIYPNPISNGKLFIKSKNSLKKDVAIYSILGNKVFDQKDVSNSIDVSSLSKGYYILKIQQENNVTEARKIIIK